jgi:NTP pyrophosphatase (non-canonical NTP hydrolase)
MEILEAQKTIDKWIKTYGVRYFDEMTSLAVLMEEVGELARIFSREFGEQSFKTGESAEGLADEMADILFVLCCLANQTGINLEEALIKNIEKKTSRDKDRHKTNQKLK